MLLFYLIPIVCDLLLFLTMPAFSTPLGWAATYGGIGEDWATSIQQTRDGRYIVAGTTSSFGAGRGDLWVLKLSSDGSINCPHNLEIGDAISSEVETCATVLETHAIVWDSNVSPQDTTAITLVTDVSPQTLWP